MRKDFKVRLNEIVFFFSLGVFGDYFNIEYLVIMFDGFGSFIY